MTPFWIGAAILFAFMLGGSLGFMFCAMLVAAKQADEAALVLREFRRIDEEYNTDNDASTSE